MLSRVAESIYWMSRYIERAENVARFFGVNLQLNLDLPEEADRQNQWAPLVSITGDKEWFIKKYGEPTRENVLKFHTLDSEYPNSILSCIRAARENARSIRENISTQMWEQINKFYFSMNNPSSLDRVVQNPFQFCEDVKNASHLFTGVTDSTMTHGEAWRFLRLGRLLERADKTSRLLDFKYFILLPQMEDIGSALDNMQWAALLKSASALEMYRRKFRHFSPDNVTLFLILDREFPRSISYCLIKAEQSLYGITGSPIGTFKNPAEKAMGKLRSELNYVSIEEIMAFGFHEFLDKTQTRINQVGDAIHETFFARKPTGLCQLVTEG